MKKLVYFFTIIIHLAIAFATTFAEENEQSTTQGVYYGMVNYHTLRVEDEIFLASPSSKIDGEVPSTMPIIVLGHLPKAKISVELWDSPFDDVFYLYKQINFCYFSTQDGFDISTVKRYNLKMRNSHRYQIRVYLLDGKGNKKLVVSDWFIRTINDDAEYIPPKE